jgi:hypothetical protein
MGAIDSSATSEDLNQQDRTGMTRRSVVRAGAAAAWAVPLVTVAAAAPSFAASGPADLGTSTITSVTRSGKDVTITGLTIKNTNSQSTNGLKVTITSNKTVASIGSNPSGWTASLSGNTITLLAASPVGGNSSAAPVNFTFTLQVGSASSITVQATTTGGAPGVFQSPYAA